MAQLARRSDGFGRELVLGLLVEEPANCYQLDRRLARRFSSAGYTNGTARQAIKRLVEEKLVRIVDDELPIAGGPNSRAMLYEATARGIEHFERWMWAAISTPPVREELHAKVALCRPGDLPRMIVVVREAESVCTGMLQSLNSRVRSRRYALDEDDFRARMDLVVSSGDQAWWESRIKWLQKVRVYLEDEQERHGVDHHSRMVLQQGW
jgi:DNA-binding PadR family transcriptional regulator